MRLQGRRKLPELPWQMEDCDANLFDLTPSCLMFILCALNMCPEEDTDCMNKPSPLFSFVCSCWFFLEKKVKKSDCGEWQWSVCVPTTGDCGLGTREGTRSGADCKQTMKTQRCKIPCNWKKQFGGNG